jgi:type II secretion system protein G
MNKVIFKVRSTGFTLIELLIVVAIIAILAAIAVPNFLEAQTRSKVARVLADMRTIRTGLESYRVDNNKYPETDLGINAFGTGKLTYFRLTTPISYLTSIPPSPFKEKYGSSTTTDPKVASTVKGYLYVRKLDTTYAVDPNYGDDREAYIEQQFGGVLVGTQVRNEARAKGEWELKSVGPDNLDDRDSPNSPVAGQPLTARTYDPTNGTVSRGDVVIFSDLPGTGKNQ